MTIIYLCKSIMSNNNTKKQEDLHPDEVLEHSSKINKNLKALIEKSRIFPPRPAVNVNMIFHISSYIFNLIVNIGKRKKHYIIRNFQCALANPHDSWNTMDILAYRELPLLSGLLGTENDVSLSLSLSLFSAFVVLLVSLSSSKCINVLCSERLCFPRIIPFPVSPISFLL